MSDNPDDHVAMQFHGLIADLQHNDVAKFGEDNRREREALAALRRQDADQGLSASELIKKLEGDPAEAVRKIEEELARADKEVQAAVAKKTKEEPLPVGSFPPPPTSS